MQNNKYLKLYHLFAMILTLNPYTQDRKHYITINRGQSLFQILFQNNINMKFLLS